MAETPEVATRPGVREDVRRLRRIFALVPWPMRWRVVGLLVAAGAAAVLDMLAVASMLPLTQMLTAQGSLPDPVRRYLVPILGTEDRTVVLLSLACLVAGAFVLKNGTLILIRWWSLGITGRAEAAAQSALLRRYLAAPYVAHRRRSRATILQTISGSVPAAFSRVLLGYITIAVYGCTVALIFAVLVALAPLASLLAIVIFGGSGLVISRALKPVASRNAQTLLDVQIEAWRYLNPAIEGFREARIFRREEHFAGGYARNRERSAGLNRSQGLLGELPKYLLEIVMVVGILAVAVLLFGTRDESTAFGLLAMFAAASVRVIPSLNILVATYNGVISGRPALAMVIAEIDDLDRDHRASPTGDPTVVEVRAADIVVDDLAFRYPDGHRDVLSGVTVTIPVGSTVALVGGSGAGKTTFADILAGLLTPTGGTVEVGGIDIAEHPRAWRANVAMVSQQVYLWDSTLRNLITFGQRPEEVDEDLLADVVRRARLTDFVEDLPAGLDTWIGEGGSRLSGGQAQRVGIARALYVEPHVLILDEATSALDNETEHEISATIEALHGSITVVVIAHRLSTVRHADEILFFAEGRLRSRGTLSHLRDHDPEFARLVELGTIA